MNRVTSTILTLAAAFSVCAGASAQHKNFVLVLDPGHGGSDPGAVHGRYHEADVNLAVALALGERVRREMEGVDVLFTRTEDRKVGLAERGNFANKAGADLFLSIHANWAANPSASGSETYVMGVDKNAANLEVAKRENEVIKYEDDYATTYAGFDPSSPEMAIALGMLQYAHFEGSLRFARLIQKRYTANSRVKDRGAKQNVFAVLWLPTMPRVLTEMGFISNAADREFMFSDRGRASIVASLFAAIGDYRASLGSGGAPPAPPATTAPSATSAPERETAAADKPADNKTSAERKSADKKPEGKAAGKPKESAPRPAAVSGARYVQLAASRTPISADDASWGPYRGKVVEIRRDGWYKYALGPYSTDAEVAEALRAARQTKFRDAFVVKDAAN